MAIDLTKYFRNDIIAVRNAGVGGKLFSAIYNGVLPNGILGGLGKGFVTGEMEIKQFVLPTSVTAKTLVPYTIQKEEINADETSRSNARLGLFRNKANKAFPVIKLQDTDEISLSADYFTKATEIVKDDVFVLNTDGLLSHADGTTIIATDYKTTFLVTSIGASHIANYIAGDGTFKPAPYKMIDLEINVQ